MKEQKKYDREFKINAVKLYRESGKTLEEVRKDLGVAKTTLYTWVREFKEQGEASFPGKGKLLPCNEELTLHRYRLRRDGSMWLRSWIFSLER